MAHPPLLSKESFQKAVRSLDNRPCPAGAVTAPMNPEPQRLGADAAHALARSQSFAVARRVWVAPAANADIHR